MDAREAQIEQLLAQLEAKEALSEWFWADFCTRIVASVIKDGRRSAMRADCHRTSTRSSICFAEDVCC